MSKTARVARRRAERAGTVEQLPDWMARETPSQRQERQHRERYERAQYERNGQSWQPRWVCDPGSEPIYDGDGRIVAWRPGAAGQAALEAKLAAVELHACDWLDNALASAYDIADDALAAMGADDRLVYFRERHPEVIVSERHARFNAIQAVNRYSDIGSVVDDPFTPAVSRPLLSECG